ncbi:unnamed protein product, partial [marine sediment metagenome]
EEKGERVFPIDCTKEIHIYFMSGSGKTIDSLVFGTKMPGIEAQ